MLLCDLAAAVLPLKGERVLCVRVCGVGTCRAGPLQLPPSYFHVARDVFCAAEGREVSMRPGPGWASS
jgi:hypothetical protein